jgi:hypothetical protein
VQLVPVYLIIETRAGHSVVWKLRTGCTSCRHSCSASKPFSRFLFSSQPSVFQAATVIRRCWSKTASRLLSFIPFTDHQYILSGFINILISDKLPDHFQPKAVPSEDRVALANTSHVIVAVCNEHFISVL